MKPMPGVIIIKADEAETVTKAGLYLSENWKTLPPTGTVEAIADDVKHLKVGDRVVFKRYGTVELENNLRIANIEHVMAKLDS